MPMQEVQGGFFLTHSLRMPARVNKIAWSSDADLACITDAKTIVLLDSKKENPRKSLIAHKASVRGLAWIPKSNYLISASIDKTLRVWDTQTGLQVRVIKDIASLYGVAVSPNGSIVAAPRVNGTIGFWNISTGALIHSLTGHRSVVRDVAWSPNGLMLASASADGNVCTWDTSTGILQQVLGEGTAEFESIAWSPDGRSIAAGSQDRTIRVWDAVSGRETNILEGHTGRVAAIQFSFDGELLFTSDANDHPITIIWRRDTWETVRAISEIDSPTVCSPAFHPSSPILAYAAQGGYVIQFWQWNRDVIFGAASETRHYRNAKVVILGDSGVGKSGLGLAVTRQAWVATESTHGRRVWSFDNVETDFPDGRHESRETLIWDLAGQPGYRLIHQLHLNEVSLALVVFDARSETDPFSGVRHWDRALRQAHRFRGSSGEGLRKYLVAARTDVGAVAVSKERIVNLVRELGFAEYFETSAKEGWGIQSLIDAIRDGVDWDSLPTVSSNTLFQEIKSFLVTKKESGAVLIRLDDLYQSFCSQFPQYASSSGLQDRFIVCIGRVENRGLIRRLSFGNYVLLQPELLDAYASSMVNAARSEPDGLGYIKEEDALAGLFRMSDDERIRDRELEKLLLIATIEELLSHDIVLKEETDRGSDLVFPSQLTRTQPDAPELPGKTMVFTFDGAVLSIYATLAVRLSRSKLFNKQEMWKDAVTYVDAGGGKCGIYLREIIEGRGELTLFFDSDTSEETRFQFEDYIVSHLQRRALHSTITRRRILACAIDGAVMSEELIKLRRKSGHTEMICPVCEKTKFTLLDREEVLGSALTNRQTAVIRQMDDAADKVRGRATSAMALKGKIESNDYDVFMCHSSADKPEVKEIAERLKERGILPWLDECAIRPGFSWQDELERQIQNIRSAAVFISTDNLGPWQRVEEMAFLRQFVERSCPVIPVILSSYKNIGKPKFSALLGGMKSVDFRKKDPDPLNQLIWGITGARDNY
jgi:GTPase SAR1 family protein